LLESFKSAEPLAAIEFQTSPNIEVSGGLNINEPRRLKVMGHAAVANFSYEGIPLSDFNAAFSWDADRILVRELRMNQRDGQLRAELVSAPSDFRLNVDSTLNPTVLKSFLSPQMQSFLREW